MSGGRGDWSQAPPGGPAKGYPKGKGKGKPEEKGDDGDAVDPPPAPRITVNTLQAGETVDVFHRYAQDPNGYFMVEHATSGMIHPSIGKTDGWTSAVVSETWDVRHFNPDDFRTWVEIRWSHPRWYNRRGHKLDVSTVNMITQRVLPEQIRKKNEASEAHEQPSVTFVMMRWGGEKPVNPVTEGAGGWGQIGSTPSDNYINGFENFVFQHLGPTYETISCFFQGSDELLKMNPALLRHLCKGQHVAAFYFCWPIIFQDGHESPAYVDAGKLLELMVHMEATGIPTRFPHQSHLYKIFASKEWTSQMCLHPHFKVPLTVKVARQSITMNPEKAAARAIQALGSLAQARSAWAPDLGQEPVAGTPVQKGVAKLGWSWEAMDVMKWSNKQELATNLTSLAEQPGSFVEQVFVQEWVDFDVEIRHFVVEPDLLRPETFKPKRLIYTVFKDQDQNSFRNFDKYDRRQALKLCFQNDDAALADAERQSQELIVRWLYWLQAQTHEMPTVTRFDILVRRTGPGRAVVKTGELTELGGCFLGWPKGPQVVFGAMLRSCFKDT